MTGFTITVAGRPTGKARARVVGGRAFTPRATVLAENEVIRAWEDAGAPRLPDGPVRLDIVLYVARPRGHFRKDGTLSAEGERHPFPHRQKPDWDNAGKLIADALNGRAWRDDVQIVDATVMRRWNDLERTVITAAPVATATTTPTTEAA